MSVIWTVNGTPVADLGITVAGGTFRTQGISYALLDAVRNFDAATVLNYGDAVTLSRTLGGTTVILFQGKVAPPKKLGLPEYEGHSYPVEDAWAELETTTYQEAWAIGAGSYDFPKAVLGLDDVGDPISVGDQIAEIIGYAISVGVNLQMGTTPSGENLWPEEVANISCAEAINRCLEFHPDWIPWIDHATVPPTFNVTTVAMMEGAAVDVTAGDVVESFWEIDRADLRPDAVRIVYEYATTIDDEVYRNAVIQKYPPLGPDGGPKVICTTIPLAGGQMQMQKSRIRVRPMPESGDLSTLTKKWVKANYPRLSQVDLEDFEVTEFETWLHVDDVADNPHPPEINERAPRLIPGDADDIPNQLLEGAIEDWMRKKTGWVGFRVKVTPASGASAEVQAELNKDFPPGRCVCTNAVTKIYKGITQWAAAEDVPEGIAQGVYESMHAAYQHEGEVVISTGELTGFRFHGRTMTLTGAATTAAAIHSVTWDVDTGKTAIGFGPVPVLAPADFLEQQKRMRGRKVTWWSKDERASATLGAEDKPSAAGDTVGGYHGPQTIFDATASESGASGGAFCSTRTDGADKYVRGGTIRYGNIHIATVSDYLITGTADFKLSVECNVVVRRTDDGAYFMEGIVSTPDGDTLTMDDHATSYPAGVDPPVSTGIGKIICEVGEVTFDDDDVPTFAPTGCGTYQLKHCGGELTYERL